MQIDYFFSLMSPFTYLAGAGLEEIAERHRATVVYRPADFHRIFAETGGLPVPQRHPSRQAYRLQELERLPRIAGMAMNIQPRHWPVDAVPASAAVIAVAKAGGDAGRLAQACLRAVWAEDRDLSDPGTLAAILEAEGCDVDAILGAADDGRAVFDANTSDAIDAGIFGAPTYKVGDALFWGQDRLPHLDWHLGQL